MSRSRNGGEQPYSTRIPADIEREDRILAGLTARQLVILAATAALLWVIFMLTRGLVPPLLMLACCSPVMAVAAAFALVRRDGLPLDRLVLAAVRQRLAPSRRIPGEPVPTPAFLAPYAGQAPAPLGLPVTAITETGVIDLGAEGCAAIVGCSTVSFALATYGEQEAMVAGFARCLHGLTTPIQVLVRAERIDLTPMAARLRAAAPVLPDTALEQAADEHAEFLTDLAARSELLWRQVLLIVRDPGPDTPADPTEETTGEGGYTPVLRLAEQAAAALTATGVSASVLDGPKAAAVLAASCDPNNPYPCAIHTASTGGGRDQAVTGGAA